MSLVGYNKRGQVNGIFVSVIGAGLAIGILTLVQVFMSTLSGSTYNLVEPDLDAITNTTVKQSVKQAALGGFEGQETLGDYIPLIVLSLVIFLVLSIILSFTAFTGAMGMRGGSAL